MAKPQIRVSGIVVSVVAGVLMLMAPPSSAQEVAQKVYKDLVLNEDAKCTRCHDNPQIAEDARALTIGKTKHGTRADGRTPTCTTCHGESQAHSERPRQVKTTDRVFGKKSKTPPEERTGVCLGCHTGKERMFWASSTHAARDVTCDTCHSVHNNGHDNVRERKTQSEICFTCHKTQRIMISKPSRHPVLEGKVICSDCHNPHGSAGEKNLVRDTVNDTCFRCHTEKRGPFIWNHQPVTENCSYCHEPHGTTVANLLKWRSPFLCQQCHEATSHRGAAPSFTDNSGTESGQRVLFARGCVNCHTNIHGSNNPINASGSRSFRQ